MKAALLILVGFLLAIALSSCASHRESAVQVDASLEKQSQAEATESVEIHRIEEPSRTVTTVEEFGAAPSGRLCGPDCPDGDSTLAHVQSGMVRHVQPSLGSDGPVVLPFHGPLIKLTTTVEDRGPITTDTSAKGSSESTGTAREALSGKADTERDSKPSLGLPVLGLVLAAVAASLILMRGLWLPAALSFAKRLLGGGT